MTALSPISQDKFQPGVRGRIVQVGKGGPVPVNGQASLEELLLDLGFEEGAAIEVRHQGPFGSPLAVQVDDRLIAIRPVDAATVLVGPDTQSASSDRTG